MKYCKAVEELTMEQLNHIAHMLLEPAIMKQTIQRINEVFHCLNIPEDVLVVEDSSKDECKENEDA